MGLVQTIRHLLRHPLARKKKGAALLRYVRWQVGSRLLAHPVAIPFVDDTRLLVERGMTGATGNVYAGLHEFSDMGFVLHALRRGDVFVDVGANVGTYCVLAAGAASARSIAFEPIPSTFVHLQENVRLNDLGDRVRCVNAGVGRAKDVLVFTEGKDTMNHVVSDPGEDTSSVRVPVTTLDDELADIGASLMVVKIDVEGWETEVFAGADSLIERDTPTALIVELNGSGARYGFDEAAIHDRLVRAGFTPTCYDPMTRRLDSLLQRSNSGNTLYVNDVDVFTTRVSEAPSHDVLGLRI